VELGERSEMGTSALEVDAEEEEEEEEEAGIDIDIDMVIGTDDIEGNAWAGSSAVPIRQERGRRRERGEGSDIDSSAVG
jgi:hypothetical protein